MSCNPLKNGCVTIGDTYADKVKLVDGAGAAATATAVTVKWKRKGSATFDISLTEASSQIDISTAGEVTQSLTTSDTGGLTAGTYTVEWVITTSGGTQTATYKIGAQARQ